MRKATAIKFYTREVYGDCGQIINARQEISRGHKDYGVEWKFNEVSKTVFLQEIDINEKVCCVLTKSGKYKEVDKKNIDKFIV